jgi:CTP:molybdopterin cytidylyltransferase MocA
VIRAAGIVLAAGRGERLGQPKAALLIEGKPAAWWAAAPMHEAGIAPVLIVLGADRAKIAAAVAEAGEIVANPDWERGQFSSLQAGLRAVPPGQWAFVTTVDALGIRAETYRALPNNTDESVEAVVPECDGRRGHPVLLSPAFQQRALAADAATSRLDRLLRSARVRLVGVADRAIYANMNIIEDFERWLAERRD